MRSYAAAVLRSSALVGLLVGIVVLCSAGDASSAEPVARWDFEPGAVGLEKVGRVVAVPGPDHEVSRNLPGLNKALGFGGDGDHLRVPDSAALRFDQGDEITIECWLQCDASGTNPYIIGKGRLSKTQENQNWALRLMKVGGSYRVSFLFRSRAGGGHAGAFHRWNSAAGVSPGKLWHHVAVSYRFGDPGSIKAFIDGVKSAGSWDLGGATTRPPVVDDAGIWIGSSRAGDPGNSWRGAIDALAVYRAILPDAVLAARVDFGEAIAPIDWAAVTDGSVSVEVFSGLANHGWPQRMAAEPEKFQVPALALVELPPLYAEGGSRARRAATMLRLAARVELPEGQRRLLLRAPSLARLRINGAEVASLGAFDMSSDAHQNMRPPAEATPYPRARLGTRDLIVDFHSRGGVHEIVLEAVVGRGAKRFALGELIVASAAPVGDDWRLLTPATAAGAFDFSPLGMELYRQQQAAQMLALADARRAQARGDIRAAVAERHAAAREYIGSLPPLEVPALPDGVTARSPVDHFLAAKLRAARPVESRDEPLAALAHDSLAILEEHCFRCHGEKDKGGLRLDRRVAALGAGESGEPAVVPGKPESSEVLRRITSRDREERMPPKGDGLSDRDLAQLKEWIAAGAPWAERTSAAAVRVPPTLDDAAFLRRLYLDTVGVFPSPEEIRSFREDASADRVERRVDALLSDPRHADHWTGYWQDVLAENPRLVKGKLNNTGPFRWWIHDALRDKLPFDQFVRELIAAGGSDFEGGARGFRIATENDAPAAAKAHVLGTAFLGTEMKCARCHDAPYHESKQRDLFALAAMLEGKPISVPSSSSVPASFFARIGERQSLVEVTLKPGVPVPPEWPFDDFGGDAAEPGPEAPRERLAWELTRPQNRRFAEVIVNRVWKRYFGQGFVEPVHDWEGKRPSHPELLDFLARDFVANGYDLDRLSRLILTSDAYRREPRLLVVSSEVERMFEAPLKRRLSAEQLVDSLFAATGVPVYSEELTFDLPGTNQASTFQNLGRPTRAWQFVSLASDRDRPSLTLPLADSIVSVMQAFGWRPDRSEPITEREAVATVLQPGMLANGLFGTWITRLSPFSDLTAVAIEAPSPGQLADALYLRLLGREPQGDERDQLVAVLAEGFEARLVKSVGEYHKEVFVPEVREVTWSNHLSPEANIYAAETESRVALGPPVSDILDPAWRERAEDVIWAIINSPEMQFTP